MTVATGWAEIGDEIADALMRLRPEDAISLDTGDAFVQFLRFRRGTVLTGPAVFVHTSDAPPGSPAAAVLAELGWARWDGEGTVAQPEVPAPLDAAGATRLAEVIVRTLRDGHGVAEPDGLTYTSFNNDGLRAPRLSTVAPGAGQPAQDPDPATLLPAPSPVWQGWCTLLADGLGDWSQAAFDRLVETQGWQPATGYGQVFTAGTGERIQAGTGDAGHRGHGEISSLTVSQPAGGSGLASAFRQALAGAVRVLGHPPLVGDEGREPFARWRGERTTLTLSAVVGASVVRLRVEPTGPRENVIYNNQKWMMSPDDWSPDELWSTEPDVEAPQAAALLGMMSYPHSPAGTIEETVDELRLLFQSWCEALPLLYPYATSARWQLRTRGGDMIADGRCSRDRVTARFGWSDQHGERVAVAPGAGVAADLAERVRAALAGAGVTTPADLRGSAWSDTPAERMYANRLTLEHS